MNNIETMKLALEALETPRPFDSYPPLWRVYEKTINEAITALRQAINAAEQREQAQQAEPVAWDGDCVLGNCGSPAGCEASNCCRADYTPPPRQPLLDEWFRKTMFELYGIELKDGDYADDILLVRAVEAAHGIKGQA